MTEAQARTLVLLTGEQERPHFETFMKRQNPALDVVSCTSLKELSCVVEQRAGRVRLIAFLTDVIVPKSILKQLIFTPYNIHPGPPEYPGSHPESFAIWDSAHRYGVTAHEMTERVDEGPIVLLDTFDMPALPERGILADQTYARAVNLFSVLEAHCAAHDSDLPRLPVSWCGLKRTKADFQRLCRPPAGLLPTEQDRLTRACGEALIAPQVLDRQKNAGLLAFQTDMLLFLRGAAV